ncbi:MAG: VCBS repeat-containing protein [Thermoplasmata archaeon]|nr:MAG: VCBS repeat-containing protein [Thermoplasmata archaeon]
MFNNHIFKMVLWFLIFILILPSIQNGGVNEISPDHEITPVQIENESDLRVSTEPIQDPAQEPSSGIRGGGNSRAQGLYEKASGGLPAGSPSGGDSGWTGIDFGDFNGDGLEDLVAVGRKGNGPEPYVSNGDGTWTYSRSGITASWSGRSDLRLVDINQDNKLDIVTSDSSVWLGDGTGSWTEATQPSFSGEDVAVGDFNNDNNLDLAIIGHLSGGIQAFYGDGKGNWVGTNASNGLPTSSGGHKITFADVNNDDNLDIITTYWYDQSVWLGDGKGNWTPSVQGMTIETQFWGVAVGDMNHDENIDVALSVFHSNSNTNGICLYQGDGTGKWTNASSGLPTSGTFGDIEMADMNNDGHLDIVAGVNAFGSAPGSVNIWYG